MLNSPPTLLQAAPHLAQKHEQWDRGPQLNIVSNRDGMARFQPAREHVPATKLEEKGTWGSQCSALRME